MASQIPCELLLLLFAITVAAGFGIMCALFYNGCYNFHFVFHFVARCCCYCCFSCCCFCHWINCVPIQKRESHVVWECRKVDRYQFIRSTKCYVIVSTTSKEQRKASHLAATQIYIYKHIHTFKPNAKNEKWRRKKNWF